MSFRARVRGLRQTDAGLSRLRRTFPRALERTIRRATDQTFAGARAAAPRGRGRSRQFPRAFRSTIQRIVQPTRGEVGTEDPRGRWLEFGTDLRATRRGAGRGRVRAQPWLGPAFDRAVRRLDTEILREISR